MIDFNNLDSSFSLRAMGGRLGYYTAPSSYQNNSNIEDLNRLGTRLTYEGGFPQQNRMIKDKKNSMLKALKYSYQGAWVRKHHSLEEEVMDGERGLPPTRALINSNKLKYDYDEKIISVPFEEDFAVGDVFEWVNTNSYWLIYLQDLTELAYFRGEIRRCSYEIKWEDEGKKYSTYAAIRGPVETKIVSEIVHRTVQDVPNNSLSILLPKNKDTLKMFQRYSKFYLSNADEYAKKICWRVEVIDSITSPGIIKVTAVEYYANKDEDDIEEGIVGAKIEPLANPNDKKVEDKIVGDTFIKPKWEYEYTYTGKLKPQWKVDSKYPVELIVDKNNNKRVTVKWTVGYSGQFELSCGNITKTIIVESLF